MTLAKLQSSVKSSFDAINDNLKEHHSALNKYSKALDKVLSPSHFYIFGALETDTVAALQR